MVLPAPLGPMTAVISPRCGGEGHVVHRGQAAEAHASGARPSSSAGRPVPPGALIDAPCGLSRIEGARVGDQAARPPDHDHHHRRAEQQHAVLGRSRGPNSGSRRSARSPPAPRRAGCPGRPSTTMASTVALSMKVKLSGLMKPWRVAKNAPAKPPNMAPMAKADSLMLVALMPSARQAISSSRSASQARPIGSRRSRSEPSWSAAPAPGSRNRGR